MLFFNRQHFYYCQFLNKWTPTYRSVLGTWYFFFFNLLYQIINLLYQIIYLLYQITNFLFQIINLLYQIINLLYQIINYKLKAGCYSTPFFWKFTAMGRRYLIEYYFRMHLTFLLKSNSMENISEILVRKTWRPHIPTCTFLKLLPSILIRRFGENEKKAYTHICRKKKNYFALVW